MAIEKEELFAVPPAAVWEIVGDVGRTDWVPGVDTCRVEGDHRHMEMAGAGRVVEQILERDPSARRLVYSVVESSPPLESHEASLHVQEVPEGTRLVWRTRVAPAGVERFIEGAMQRSLDALHELLQG